MQTMVERNRENETSMLPEEPDEPLDDGSEPYEVIDDTEDDGEAESTDADGDEPEDEISDDSDDDLGPIRIHSNRKRRIESDSDEFDASDAEFDNIVASYQEPEVEDAIDTAPSTCQQVEEVVSVQVELEVSCSRQSMDLTLILHTQDRPDVVDVARRDGGIGSRL
jgi:hypothetical protein